MQRFFTDRPHYLGRLCACSHRTGFRKASWSSSLSQCRSRSVHKSYGHRSCHPSGPQCHRNGSSQCSTTAEDPALHWARANPDLALSCMKLPCSTEPLQNDFNFSDFFASGGGSWDDYWDRRQWEFPGAAEIGLQHAKALTTHVLTAPLILFAASPLLLRPSLSADFVAKTSAGTGSTRMIRLCCLGARSEASLPVEYWKELLLLLGTYHGNSVGSYTTLKLQFDFCGPEMDARRPDVTLTTENDHGLSQMTIRWVYRGKYHDYYEQSLRNGEIGDHKYDAFVLFNPGVGHAHLRNDWNPTLDLLFGGNRAAKRNIQGRQHHSVADVEGDAPPGSAVVLLTAHSALDAARDTGYMREHLNVDLKYVENPFASRICYQDPFHQNHTVRPNQYVALTNTVM